MNKQQVTLLNEVRLIIEENNALKADKAALIDALRHCVTACEHCDHYLTKPCFAQPGHAIDCVSCTDSCPCRECKAGSHFKWVGRVELGKHAIKENPLPLGIGAAMKAEAEKIKENLKKIIE